MSVNDHDFEVASRSETNGIWHVISRSGVVISITNCYIHVYFIFTLMTCSDKWHPEIINLLQSPI